MVIILVASQSDVNTKVESSCYTFMHLCVMLHAQWYCSSWKTKQLSEEMYSLEKDLSSHYKLEKYRNLTKSINSNSTDMALSKGSVG